MKRLLVLSHAAVLDVNRALFQKLAEVAEAEVTLVVPRSWKGDLIHDLRFEATLNDRRLRVVSVPTVLSGNGSLFFYARSLSRISREARPDWIFVDEEPWSLSALQAFRAFRDHPRCFFTKQNLRKRLPAPFRAAERWIFDQSSFAYAVSDEVADVLRWKGFGKEIRNLPHSYDPALFRPLDAETRAGTRRKLGIPEDATVVAYFGRLTPEKGVEDLLSASERLIQDHGPKTHLLVVGNGPLADRVREAVGRAPRGRMTFTPAVRHHEVGAALGACDLLVLPSRTTPAWKEQFGRILVEALACGAAIAGSDSGEIPQVVRQTQGGVVFRENDPADLAEKVGALASDVNRLRALAATGADHVRSKLTHHAVATDLARNLGFTLL